MSGRRRRGLRCLVLALAGVLFTAAPAAAAGAPARPVERVLVLSLPGTTWAALTEAHTPHLDRLMAGSAVANCSIRVFHRRTREGEGYTTIGAGTLAAGRPGLDNLAFLAGEPFEEGTAAQAFTRRTGRRPAGEVLSLAAPALVADASQRHRGAEIGALGEALARAGVGRAVIANADRSLRRGDLAGYRREAALALADRQGAVERGQVGRSLLRRDPAAFGLGLDPAAVAEAFRREWRGRSVVLVEASDLARAHAFRRLAAPAHHPTLVGEALAATDRMVGVLLAEVDPASHAVLVVAPSSPAEGVHLTVAALRAPGVAPGLLRSASTRRSGLVTLPDVGPTVLGLLGLPRPASMEGRRFEVGRPGRGVSVARLVEVDREARVRDRMFTPVATTFVGAQVALSLAAVIALWRRRGREAVAFVALWLLAVLPLTYVSAVFDATAPWAYWLLVGGGGLVAALAAAALAGRGGRHPLRPVGALLGLLLGLLVVDVATGARLQLSTVFGYSPTVGGRFAGLGNLAFAQLAASAALLAGVVAHLVGGRRGVSAGVAVLVVALLADGMPVWGSDVGGVLSAFPAFSIVALGLAGARLSPGRVAALAGGTVAAVAVFGTLDLARPSAERTHLGRLLEAMGDEGLRPLGEAVQRKMEANLAVLPHSVWVPLVPATLAFLAWLAWGGSGRLRAVRSRAPELRPALAGVLVAGALGFALNDSGIAVPAMMLGVLNPVLVHLALCWE